MKKILVFCMAVACCLCLSTACGNTKDSSQTSDTTNADQTTAPPEEIPGEEFVEVYQKFFLSENPEDAVDSTLPAVVIDKMKKINAFDYISSGMMSAIAQSIAGSSADKYPEAEYISQRACDPELKNDLQRLYSAYYQLFEEISGFNIDYTAFIDGTLDEPTMSKIQECIERFSGIAQGEEEQPEMTVEIEDVRFVTLSIDGSYVEILFYKVKDEDWRIDSVGAAVFGY